MTGYACAVCGATDPVQGKAWCEACLWVQIAQAIERKEIARRRDSRQRGTIWQQ